MRDTPWTGDQPRAGHTLTPGGWGVVRASNQPDQRVFGPWEQK